MYQSSNNPFRSGGKSVSRSIMALTMLLVSCFLWAGCNAQKSPEKLGEQAQAYTVGEHDDLVTVVAVSPDGSTIASSNAAGEVKLWQVPSGELLQTVQGDNSSIWDLSFSPDGKHLVGGGVRGSVYMWDLSKGTVFWKGEHGETVKSLAYSSDGKWVASAGAKDSAGDRLRLWEAATGKLVDNIDIQATVKALRFTTNDKLLIYAQTSATAARVLEAHVSSTLGEPKQLQVLEHENHVSEAVIAPSGKKVITGGRGGTIYIWDFEHDGMKPTKLEAKGIITAIALSPDGQKLVSGVLYRGQVTPPSLLLWDLEKGTEIDSLQDENSIISVSSSPDREWIVYSHLRSVKLWNLVDR